MTDEYHLHLVSDSTGETNYSIARACLVQFEDVEVDAHQWSMIRTKSQLDMVIKAIEERPGPVIFTLVDGRLREALEQACARIGVPCIPILDPLIGTLSRYFGREMRGQPGRQHEMTAEYFDRIEAMNYVMGHDDGRATADLEKADIVLVGVSRTSKTPTSVYLANHFGIKTANVPIVPGIEPPEQLAQLERTFVVGLTAAPERLVQIRRNRLLLQHETKETAYVDLDAVSNEIAAARRFFAKHGWPVIDVTRRSIEETAAAIYQLYTSHRQRLVRAAGE